MALRSPAPASPMNSQPFAPAGQAPAPGEDRAAGEVAGEDYARIVAAGNPYVAVVKDEELQHLISRDQVALLVARRFTGRLAG